MTFQPSAFAAAVVASVPSLITSAASTGPMTPMVFIGSCFFAGALVCAKLAEAPVADRAVASATTARARLDFIVICLVPRFLSSQPGGPKVQTSLGLGS